MDEHDDDDDTARPRRRRDRRSQSDHAASFPFYFRDWLSAAEVRALTADQRGRYVDVLCFTWGTRHVGVMTEDEVRQWAGYAKREWPRHRAAFARCFFIDVEGMWIQKRAKRERAAMKKRWRKASEAGKKGAQKKKARSDLPRVAAPQAGTRALPNPIPSPTPTKTESKPAVTENGSGSPPREGSAAKTGTAVLQSVGSILESTLGPRMAAGGVP